MPKSAEDQDYQDLSVKKEIGARLRRWRKIRNLTQEELGTLIGVSKETISQYESGGRGMSAHDLPKVAGVLGITVGCLFDERTLPWTDFNSKREYEETKRSPTTKLNPDAIVTEVEWEGIYYLKMMSMAEQRVAVKILRVLWDPDSAKDPLFVVPSENQMDKIIKVALSEFEFSDTAPKVG